MKSTTAGSPAGHKMGTAKEQLLFNHLILKQTFIEAVKSLRGKYLIPQEGFQNDSEWIKWHEKMNQEHREVEVIREEFVLNADDKPVLKSKQKVKRRINSYYFDLCKLLMEIDLSLEWVEFVDEFVGLNRNSGKVSVHEAVFIKESYKGVSIEEFLQLNLGATMTQERFIKDPLGGKNIWVDVIQPLQSLMQGSSEKDSRPKNSKTEIQAQIDNMTRAGLRDKEIYEELPQIERIQTIRQHRKRLKDKSRLKVNS